MFFGVIIEKGGGVMQPGADAHHQAETVRRKARILKGAEEERATADFGVGADRCHDGNMMAGLRQLDQHADGAHLQ